MQSEFCDVNSIVKFNSFNAKGGCLKTAVTTKGDILIKNKIIV